MFLGVAISKRDESLGNRTFAKMAGGRSGSQKLGSLCLTQHTDTKLCAASKYYLSEARVQKRPARAQRFGSALRSEALSAEASLRARTPAGGSHSWTD